MSTRRTKEQTKQVRIFSTQSEPMKKFHISQLVLKFHMVSFPISVKRYYLKNQCENCMSIVKAKPMKFLTFEISPGFYFLEPSRERVEQWVLRTQKRKEKKDGAIEEKRKERRKGCALVTREFLSLPIK